MSACQQQTQPSPPSLISCHSSDERGTRGVVFEDTKCPLALETLLSHNEWDKCGGNAKGSDHRALQRRVGELLMPDSESVTSSHRLIWEQFFIFWHMKGKTMKSIFSPFIIVSFTQQYRRIARRYRRKKRNYGRQQSEKNPELKRVKVQSASEKVTNICTENSYTNWSNLWLPVKKRAKYSSGAAERLFLSWWLL